MSGESTRWTIIRDAANGDERARAEFARRYEDVIRAYLGARWRGASHRDEIDDAAQEVFVQCFRSESPLLRADPDRRGGFRAFLYGLVRNVARMSERTRKRRREQQSEGDLNQFEVDETPLPEVFDRAWARAIMRDAADLHLERARADGPDALRRHKLLVLRYGDNLPIREIAARWKVDAALLHREYPKAREEFKRSLMDVIRELQGGDPGDVERECAQLLTHLS